MLAGSSGFRLMPRKMAGIATITIDPSMVAIVMLSVVLDRAIHLYRSGRPTAAPDPFDAPFRWFVSTLCRTFTFTQLSESTCLIATIYLAKLTFASGYGVSPPGESGGGSSPGSPGAAGDVGVVLKTA